MFIDFAFIKNFGFIVIYSPFIIAFFCLMFLLLALAWRFMKHLKRRKQQNQGEYSPSKKREGDSSREKAFGIKRNLVWIFLSLLPFLFLIVWLFLHNVDIPYWDQWEFVPLIEEYNQGDVSPYTLCRQHNEHRLFFPKMIMLILADLTHWNISYELVVNVVLAFGIFLLFVFLINFSLKSYCNSGKPWIIPLVSLLLFSLSQWENWIWGWQIQIFLNILTLLGGILLLTLPGLNGIRIISSIILGIIATFSFANGLLFWPLGLVYLLFVAEFELKKKKYAFVGLWAVVSIIIHYSYFFDYVVHPDQSSYLLVFQRPFDYLIYVLKFVGSPIMHFSAAGAVVMGMVGTALFVYLIWILLKNRRFKIQELCPYIFVGLFSLGSAFMIGFGRVGIGSGQAMHSRYTAFSSLLWISNFVFIYFLSTGKEVKRRQGLFYQMKKMTVPFLALFSALIIGSAVYGSRLYLKRCSLLLQARKELRLDKTDDAVKKLYYNEAVIKERVKILKKYKISVFREEK